jgi:hypothetical protein
MQNIRNPSLTSPVPGSSTSSKDISKSSPSSTIHDITPEQLSIYQSMREMDYSVDIIFYTLEHGAFDVDSAIELANTHFSPTEAISGSAAILPMPSACPICERDLSQIPQVRIPGCGHWFCIECVKQFIEIRVADNIVLRIPCLNHECDNKLEASFIQELISPSLLHKYLKFKREAELSLNANLRWCPKPDCEGYDIGGTRKRTLTCNVCFGIYCYYCSVEITDEHSDCKGLVDYQLDQWSKQNNIKHCPNCKRRVEKVVGCNHMTCVKCRYEWCWLCGEKYENKHWTECEFSKVQKKDVSWFIILGLLMSPVLWPFVLVIFAMVYTNDRLIPSAQNDALGRFLKMKIVSFPVVIAVAMIMTPPALIFGVMFAGIGVLIELGESFETQNNLLQMFTSKTWVWVPFSIIVGTAISPVVVVSTVIGIGIAHITGIALVFYKLHIYVRRLFDPSYLNVTANYGNY